MMTADELRRDITPFSDPATDVIITEGTGGFLAKLIRNGAEHAYFFDRQKGTITSRHDQRKQFLNMRSLIASADFADMRGYANTLARMLADFDPDDLISPEGEIEKQPLTRRALETALSLPKSKDANPDGKIRIAIIDGPAGVGKTSLIRAMVVRRSRAQSEVNAQPPILHVESRGKGVTGLDDRIAQSLQLVRAKFTFDQTPILVRFGLLQIAIDGFDELADPAGYLDAYAALRNFFEDIGYGGPIILAGRDTFFDQQRFETQLDGAAMQIRAEFEVSHIRLTTPSTSTARTWLAKKGWSEVELEDSYTNLVLRPNSYALRPYFLSVLAKTKGWSAIDSQDLTPREFLMERFLDREADVLMRINPLGTDSQPVKRSTLREGLVRLFEEIALDMADNETDAVDPGFLQIVTEMEFGNVLRQIDLDALKHRASSLALLEQDQREGYRRFPHTEISNHFLASALIRYMADGNQPRCLRRMSLSADFLAVYAESLMRLSGTQLKTFLVSVRRTLTDEITFERLSENMAAFAISALCCDDIDVRDYYGLSISDAVLFGAVAPACLEQLKIQRLDASEADLTQVKFIDCEVVYLTVDETTKFGRTHPKVSVLLFRSDDGKIREEFTPAEIERWFVAHSAPTEAMTVQNVEAIRLFEKICFVMLRQHQVKDHSDDPYGKLLTRRYWRDIEKILMDEKFLDRRKSRPSSGPAAEFVRLKDPHLLLTGRENSPQVKRIWDTVNTIPIA